MGTTENSTSQLNKFISVILKVFKLCFSILLWDYFCLITNKCDSEKSEYKYKTDDWGYRSGIIGETDLFTIRPHESVYSSVSTNPYIRQKIPTID